MEISSVTDVGKALHSSLPRLSWLFAWVSSGKWCSGSSQLQGTLLGPGCSAASRSLGKCHLPPTCANMCPKSLHGVFCRDHSLHPLWEGSSGMQGGQEPASSRILRARELCPEQSALQFTQIFHAIVFSVLLQDVSMVPAVLACE